MDVKTVGLLVSECNVDSLVRIVDDTASTTDRGNLDHALGHEQDMTQLPRREPSELTILSEDIFYSQVCIVDDTGCIKDKGNLDHALDRVQDMTQLPREDSGKPMIGNLCILEFTNQAQQPVKRLVKVFEINISHSLSIRLSFASSSITMIDDPLFVRITYDRYSNTFGIVDLEKTSLAGFLVHLSLRTIGGYNFMKGIEGLEEKHLIRQIVIRALFGAEAEIDMFKQTGISWEDMKKQRLEQWRSNIKILER